MAFAWTRQRGSACCATCSRQSALCCSGRQLCRARDLAQRRRRWGAGAEHGRLAVRRCLLGVEGSWLPALRPQQMVGSKRRKHRGASCDRLSCCACFPAQSSILLRVCCAPKAADEAHHLALLVQMRAGSWTSTPRCNCNLQEGRQCFSVVRLVEEGVCQGKPTRGGRPISGLPGAGSPACRAQCCAALR